MKLLALIALLTVSCGPGAGIPVLFADSYKVCSKNRKYTAGPFVGSRGGCYCTNPNNGRKKYIERSYCGN